MLFSAYFLLYRVSVVTLRRLLISVRSTSCATASSPPLRRGALRFWPTILRDDEFDDAALGSAAGADCDDDGMLSYRSNLSLSPRRRAVLATLLEIVYWWYVTVFLGSDGANVGVYTRRGTFSSCLTFLLFFCENEAPGALGIGLSSKALTLRCLCLPQNRETV